MPGDVRYDENAYDDPIPAPDSEPSTPSRLNNLNVLSDYIPLPIIPSITDLASGWVRRPPRRERSRAASEASEASDGSTTPPPSYFDEDRESRRPQPAFRPAVGDDGELPPPGGGWARCGVRWEHAAHGHFLLAQSMPGAAAGALPPRPALMRRLYVDGAAYILRGLPRSLTAEERSILREALPGTLRQSARSGEHVVLRPAGRPGSRRGRDAVLLPPERTIAHRVTASVTFGAILFASFILPCIQLLLQQAYRYERRHRISDRMVAYGLVTVDALGRRTYTLGNTVHAVNEGRVHEAMLLMVMWWLQGVSRGVRDGVARGLTELGWTVNVALPVVDGDGTREEDGRLRD